MFYDSKMHHRKSIRLKYYDYSLSGLYFITICTQNRLHLFGEIVGESSISTHDQMDLNNAGKMIQKTWNEIANNFTNIKLHDFVIMPNHIHGIIEIMVGAPLVGAQNPVDARNKSMQLQSGQPQGIAPTGNTLADVVGAFKSITTNKYIQMVKQKKVPPFDKRIWQRNYWEHIVRNENEYNDIAQYIVDNPQKWELDELNAGSGNYVMETQTF